MHEFSIALNIVEIAEKSAKENHATKINEVEIEVGEVSGVIHEALEMALQSAVNGTMLEKAKLVIHNIKAKAICNQCKKEFKPDNLVTVCPVCGSFGIDILKGKEMRVKSIHID